MAKRMLCVYCNASTYAHDVCVCVLCAATEGYTAILLYITIINIVETYNYYY